MDNRSRKDLKEILDELIRSGVRLVLITHRFEELPSGITHVLQMKDGQICLAGEKERVLGSVGVSEETQEDGIPSLTLHDLPYSSFIENEKKRGQIYV